MTSRGVPEYVTGALIYRGAEGDLYRGTWQGLESVFKVRKPMPYRHPLLDETIRRQRTFHEAEALRSADDSGVMTPSLYFVDPIATTLVMEYVIGTRLKDMVADLSRATLGRTFRELGKCAGRLHSSGIVHGDLTTANVVIRGNDLVLLDFGLSSRSTRTEDFAVDLRLIKETITGAHSSQAGPAFSHLIDGYSQEVGKRRGGSVLKQLRAIERRGRYARMA